MSAFRDSTSFSVEDDHDVLASIQNSSWGGEFGALLIRSACRLTDRVFFPVHTAMMLEAEEEEQMEGQ